MSIAPVITIDGPAGSGKGTISQAVAQQLDWHLLDSGALYRLTALAVTQYGTDINNEAKVANVAATLNVVFAINHGKTQIFLDNNDVTQAIRTETCGTLASKVAVLSDVRAALLKRQQDFRQAPGLVADGRDMGTLVFIDAPVKIYLTASAKIRAIRRQKQLKQQGMSATLDRLIQDIEERDARDSQRAVAPLKPASDAHIIDTDSLTIDEVVAEVMKYTKTRL